MRRKGFCNARQVLFAFIVIVFGSYVISAQGEISGTWTSKTSEKDPERIQINFKRTSDADRNYSNGSSFDISDLQGISSGQLVNGSGNFRIVSEAGSIELNGTFNDGKGSGTFRFVPDHSYARQMSSRGFDFEKPSKDGSSKYEERMFTAAMLDVRVALADDLRSSNFPDLDVSDLFKAKIFKIDGKFVAEMAATGFPDLSMEDMVKARIFKIDANYVRGIKDAGFGADKFEHLVKYSIFKVTPEYLTELRNEGLTGLSPEEVVKLRIFRVDGAFVRNARAEDPNISVKKIVEKKIGVRTR